MNRYRCTIKISRGAGVVTPSKPPPPYEQHLPLPTPCFKMFLERSLNDPPPPPPHFKHLSLLPPTPSTTPSPQKKILIIHQCRTGRVFHVFCLFHLKEWSSWNSGERFQRFWTFISVRSELEQVEFKIFIPVIPLPDKSQNNNAV